MGEVVEEVVAVGVNMENHTNNKETSNAEDDSKKTENMLINRRLELKEQFLREEISAEEYTRLKNDLEEEAERLEKEAEELKIKELSQELNKLKSEEDEHVLEQSPRITHKNKLRNNKMGLAWKYASIILGMLVIISFLKGGFDLGASGIGTQKAGEQTIKFINTNLLQGGSIAVLKDVSELESFYKIDFNIGDQKFESYVTKEGRFLFPQGINLDEELDVTGKASEPNVPERNKAELSEDDDPSIGPKDAPITIIEFSDYQCPFCARAEPAVKRVLEFYKGKVNFVYRDFPLSFHQYAQKAAEASECADEQGKFWQYHDILFEKQSEWSSGGVLKLKEYAIGLGLDSKKFNECLDSGKYANEVQKDIEDGQNYGVSGTPAFFINGIEVSGAQPFDVFQKIIDAELNKQPAQTGKIKEFEIKAFRFGYTPNEIEVSEGDNVKIVIDNTDTLHGMRIPDLGVRGDNVIQFVANKKGEFNWYCNNVCGTGHQAMIGKLIVK